MSSGSLWHTGWCNRDCGKIIKRSEKIEWVIQEGMKLIFFWERPRKGLLLI